MFDQEPLVRYALSKPGTRETYPFGPEAMVLKVASKMFALLSNRGGQPAISLKCDPFVAERLREQYGAVQPGYHLNKTHWNTVLLEGDVSIPELEGMIDHSYELVVHGLKKSEKDALKAGNASPRKKKP